MLHAVLQYASMHCNTLQYATIRYDTLQYEVCNHHWLVVGATGARVTRRLSLSPPALH